MDVPVVEWMCIGSLFSTSHAFFLVSVWKNLESYGYVSLWNYFHITSVSRIRCIVFSASLLRIFGPWLGWGVSQWGNLHGCSVIKSPWNPAWNHQPDLPKKISQLQEGLEKELHLQSNLAPDTGAIPSGPQPASHVACWLAGSEPWIEFLDPKNSEKNHIVSHIRHVLFF